MCRSLRGNVDRNLDIVLVVLIRLNVVPYVGTWIEIETPLDSWHLGDVVPYVGTWIEIRSRYR